MFNVLVMNEQEHNEAKMARWADKVLGQLPGQQAPATLAPRIRAAVARLKALPWYRRPWLQWPLGWRLLSLGLASSASAAISYWGLPAAPTVGSPADLVPGYHPTVTIAGAFATVAHGLFHAVAHAGTWTIAMGLAVAGALWCLSLGLGTVCWRLSVRDN